MSATSLRTTDALSGLQPSSTTPFTQSAPYSPGTDPTFPALSYHQAGNPAMAPTSTVGPWRVKPHPISTELDSSYEEGQIMWLVRWRRTQCRTTTTLTVDISTRKIHTLTLGARTTT